MIFNERKKISWQVNKNQFACIQLKETIINMLCHGIEPKSLHLDIGILELRQRIIEYQVKCKKTKVHQSLFDELLV